MTTHIYSYKVGMGANVRYGVFWTYRTHLAEYPNISYCRRGDKLRDDW